MSFTGAASGLKCCAQSSLSSPTGELGVSSVAVSSISDLLLQLIQSNSLRVHLHDRNIITQQLHVITQIIPFIISHGRVNRGPDNNLDHVHGVNDDIPGLGGVHHPGQLQRTLVLHQVSEVAELIISFSPHTHTLHTQTRNYELEMTTHQEQILNLGCLSEQYSISLMLGHMSDHISSQGIILHCLVVGDSVLLHLQLAASLKRRVII